MCTGDLHNCKKLHKTKNEILYTQKIKKVQLLQSTIPFNFDASHDRHSVFIEKLSIVVSAIYSFDFFIAGIAITTLVPIPFELVI